MCKTADLFEGTTSVDDKGLRGEKVAVTRARGELRIANTKHSAAAEEEGGKEIST